MKPDSNDIYRLVADIGGTNARFALLSESAGIEQVHSLPCANYPDIVSAVQHYLALVGEPDVSEAAMAIANPIHGDEIRMTNHSWSFSISKTAAALGLQRLIFKNDFTAQALAVPHLQASELKQIGGTVAEPETAIAVLGPGTGLGVSGLVWSGDHWVPLAGEGGHVSVSPATERECRIVEICQRKFGHVSAERLVSGMGLQNLHLAICELEGVGITGLAPADITGKALAGSDPLCEETVSLFCSILGSVAGNLALTLGAKSGVYIGGGIVPRLGELFAASPFRQRFEEKGRFKPYLENIPVFVVHAKNPALIGIGTVF